MTDLNLSVGLTAAPQAGGSAAPNPNLLLWSEELQQATWSKSGAVATADFGLDSAGQMTADRVVFDPFGTVTQTTATAASSGAEATEAKLATATLQRFSVSGTFDGVDYHWSCYAKTASGTADFILTARRSGGFIQVEVQDFGDGATIQFSWLKLETPDLTTYVKREGS